MRVALPSHLVDQKLKPKSNLTKPPQLARWGYVYAILSCLLQAGYLLLVEFSVRGSGYRVEMLVGVEGFLTA